MLRSQVGFFFVGIFAFGLIAIAVGEDMPTSPHGNRECETFSVINQSPEESYVITRCSDKRDVGNSDITPISAESNNFQERRSKNSRPPFNTFNELDAQVSVAESTERIKAYTLYGVWIGGIGLLALGLTLAATLKAAHSASRATEAAFESNRAFVMMDDIEVSEVRNTGPLGSVDGVSLNGVLKNFGHSPAFDIELHVAVQTSNSNGEAILNIEIDRGTSITDCPPGQERSFRLVIPTRRKVGDFVGRFLTLTQFTPLTERYLPQQFLYVYYRVSYLDVQRVRRKSEDCFAVLGLIEDSTGNVTLHMNHLVSPVLIISDNRNYNYDGAAE